LAGHNGNLKPPVRKELTEPNQRWCWDISYLMTHHKGQYLYLLLDEWSRKTIQWRIAWAQTAEESRWLLEGGLIDQNILDLPEGQRPEILNDRGRQMKAKPIQRSAKTTACPRTPNDNPLIDSAFSTINRAPEYPGRFLDDREVVTYFTRYFPCQPGASLQQPPPGHRGRATGYSPLPAPAAPGGKPKEIRRAKNQEPKNIDQPVLRSIING
jgi:transposase InsO family protein